MQNKQVKQDCTRGKDINRVVSRSWRRNSKKLLRSDLRLTNQIYPCPLVFPTLVQHGFGARFLGTPHFSSAPLFDSCLEYRQPTILNNSSSTAVRAARTRECLNIPAIIAPTSLIIRTLLIMCGTTILLPMISPNS